MIGLQIILRYFFGNPFVWIGELATWLFIWLIYLGSIVLVHNNDHLKVDIVFERLPSAIKQWSRILVNLLVLSFLILIIYQTIIVLNKFGMTPSPSMKKIPMGFFFSSGLVFATISAVDLLRQSISILGSIINRRLTNEKKGTEY
jgi:TRAP-type C4-dicarboxylate transport system permease small subunit